MGEEADTKAVNAHVDRVDGQRRLLDDLALALQCEDLLRIQMSEFSSRE
jgi:hypothetical protein